MPDKLRNLHNELRELRSESKHLRTGLPRIIKSIERRQRMLEARVDVFASRGAFMSFHEAGDENVKQKLKALHDDLEQLKYKVGCDGGRTLFKLEGTRLRQRIKLCIMHKLYNCKYNVISMTFAHQTT